ncbi:MAG: shikimate kinase, partial [Eubacteriales bacterium]|nr:shikimate kinase [Eubacteriales bacterium]
AKAEKGLAVRDASREEKIIQKLTENVGEPGTSYIKRIYDGIFAASCQLEHGNYGVLGGVNLNSKSPFIHKAFGNDNYRVFRVAAEDLQGFAAENGLDGYNITIPHKVGIMKYLDEITPVAAAVGAVNTVTVRNGKKIGHNTDVAGFCDALAFHNITVRGKKVCVLGGGGASKAVCFACEKENAKEIVTVSRTGKIGYADTAAYADAEVLINCTPVGAGKGNADCPVDINAFNNLEAVYDLIYEPEMTRLVYEARQKGINARNGLYMLIAQAAYSHELFTGTCPGTEALENLYRAMSPERTVLIGMPGAGKTELGRLIAICDNASRADTDEMIENETGMRIPEIFEKYGATRFREIEKEVIKRLAADPPDVISFGGGAVLDKENRYYIKSMGKVYWVLRDAEKLDKAGRPLSVDLKKLAGERYPIYESLCDVKISNDGRISEALEKIMSIKEKSGH